MIKLVVVYHSGYGHTEQQAKAVAEGARAEEGVQVEVMKISPEGDLSDDQWQALGQAKAIIFGSPTYMGSVSWQFKKFADASSKPWFGQQWKDKLAAGFTNSASMNGDKLSTLHYLFTLAMQHGMLWVGLGLLPANRQSSGRNDPNWLGSFCGAMAQSPSDVGPDEGPLPGDLATAKLLGARMAQQAKRLG